MRLQKLAQVAFLVSMGSASACALVLGDFDKNGAGASGGSGGSGGAGHGGASSTTASVGSTGGTTTSTGGMTTSTGGTTTSTGGMTTSTGGATTVGSSTTAVSSSGNTTGASSGSTTTGASSGSTTTAASSGATTSSSSGTTSNACTGGADLMALDAHAAALLADEANCVLGNATSAAIAACMQTATGISAGCADCYGAAANCVAVNCASLCTMSCPDGSVCPDLDYACSACLNGFCGNALTACTGLPACPFGQVICNGACVDIAVDNANCGACNHACSGGQVCDDGDGTCGACNAPTPLHPPSLDAGTGTIFCPFSAADGGANKYCTAGTQHCCQVPSPGTSTCQPVPTACPVGPGDIDWQCEDPVSDCNFAKPVCCATGAALEPGPKLSGSQCRSYSTTITQATCVGSGQCQGLVLCTADAECPTPQKCTPFLSAGSQLGGCM